MIKINIWNYQPIYYIYKTMAQYNHVKSHQYDVNILSACYETGILTIWIFEKWNAFFLKISLLSSPYSIHWYFWPTFKPLKIKNKQKTGKYQTVKTIFTYLIYFIIESQLNQLRFKI